MADRDDAKYALDKKEGELVVRKNVVGTGLRPMEDGSGEAIAVYVSEKVPVSDLAPDDIIPESVEVERAGKAVKVPVRVIAVGGKFTREMPE